MPRQAREKQRQARDIAKDKALVREKWQLVHANIKVDDAMKAFLTQNLDVCGQTIAVGAFDLVRQVLNPKGYVRRDNKSEMSNLGAVVRNPESAWAQQGKNIDTKWDFHDVFWRHREKWHQEDHYQLLSVETVNGFCEETKLEPLPRNENARYSASQEDVDATYSLPVVDSQAKYVDVLKALPGVNAIKRWQTLCSKKQSKDMQTMYSEAKYSELQQSKKKLEPYWRFALRINTWVNGTRAASKRAEEVADDVPAPADETQQPAASGKQKTDCDATKAAQTIVPSVDIEATHILAVDAFTHDDASGLTTAMQAMSQDIIARIKQENSFSDDPAVKASAVYLVSDPDLKKFLAANGVAAADYAGKTKIARARAVWNFVRANTNDIIFAPPQIVRVDMGDRDGGGDGGGDGDSDGGDGDQGKGKNKGNGGIAHKLQNQYGYWTKHRTCRNKDKPDLILKIGYFSEETGLFKQRCVMAEIDGDDKTARPTSPGEVDSIKLALKLMTSTSVQAVLQPETYHIRSNLSVYQREQIQKSLLATTNVELPDFQAFISGLQSDSTQYSDLSTFQNAVHWVHHLFLSHVKIAFLIHMREVHGIDMLCSDTQDTRMRDHYFFINFAGSHLPTELVFEHGLAPNTRAWMEQQLMLLTRVKIKCHKSTSAQASHWESPWESAPVVNASSRKANMCAWSANVRSMSLPDFPYEENAFMPVACATVQRVNMSELRRIVTEAALKADSAYIDARTLRTREGKTAACRQFPDRCFLTRRQQLSREHWWNASKDSLGQDMNKLRQPTASETDDHVEFNWGYEKPDRQRSYTDVNDKRWDQIDVRMHFFDKYMRQTEWKKAADGMWYIQDYVDFMAMLQKLELDSTGGCNGFGSDACTLLDGSRLPGAAKGNKMPACLQVHDRACHRFSVLSWFFDCRDAGACRYTWEDWVLDYFGAYATTEGSSKFEQFVHVDKLPDPQHTYFGNRWFEICLFLEQNFRNAMAPMHYKLFVMEGAKSIKDLQGPAIMLYNRQKSLLNNRSVFAGLQVGDSNGSSLLSFRRFDPASNANMTLRERIMSQLHDELPALDPFLQKYIQQFRIPDAELFLRVIRCPNVLALRELAVQHRHLLGGENTASSVQPMYHLQQTLKFFPLAVQSEILYMLKFVERDDSVYVHSPAIHETKLVLVSNDLMRRWIRETLEVSARVQSLLTPLQIKCYLFTMPEVAGVAGGAFEVFKKLFYTTEALMNAGSKRSILFVLLQIRLALLILKNAGRGRTNPLLECYDVTGVGAHTRTEALVWTEQGRVPWTAGSCLECWPRRDLNEFVIPDRNVFVLAVVERTAVVDRTAVPIMGISLQQPTIDVPTIDVPTIDVLGLDCSMLPAESKKAHIAHTVAGQDAAMREHERCLWLLLLYARPNRLQFTAEDNTYVSQVPEYSESGLRSAKDVIVAKLTYTISSGGLGCVIVDNQDTALFFEKVPIEQITKATCPPFPAYVEAIISTLPARESIYVPQVFAKELRCDPLLHAKVWEYKGSKWQMVCVGTRAWAWKRLLVKSIFFDALCKVVTRSSVQLSLYGPISKASDSSQNTFNDILARHKDTSSVFGSLPYKMARLRHNQMPKPAQLVFTTHTANRRLGTVDGVGTAFTEKKIPSLRRQVEWVKFCNSSVHTLSAIKSSRFMLLDERLAAKILSQHSDKVYVLEKEVLLYRSYLYMKEEHACMVVCFRKQLYIKFPHNYAVIRNGNDYLAGQMQHSSSVRTYGTCFDTRTYSCVPTKLTQRADSREMMELLKTYSATPNLSIQWASTSNMKSDCCSWMYEQDRTPMSRNPVTFETLEDNEQNVLSEQDQQEMYTLPDLFTLRPDKIDRIGMYSDKNNVTPEKWRENIQEWKAKDKQEQKRLWIALRCTTRRIYTSAGILMQTPERIENGLLQRTLREISGKLQTQTNLDNT
jgi:hypothetical protein